MKNTMFNILLSAFGFEMNSIKRIITETPNELIAKGTYTELMAECDKVFIDRLANYPIALKLVFWEKHFELESLNDFPEINGHLLDFGCGSGHLDILLAQRGFTITGIDASPIAIRIANYYKNKSNKEIADRLDFLLEDITKPNIHYLKFDSVWSTQVFEHLPNPGPIISGIRQYVREGGYYLICVPLGEAYNDPGHCNHFYSENDLHDFLSPYISVKKTAIDEKNQVIRSLCQF